jgi:branched-chain amino acid transport system permease protein
MIALGRFSRWTTSRAGLPQVAALSVFALLVIIPILTQEPYHARVVSNIILTAIMGMAVTVVFGYAGQFSLAYGVLCGVGGYSSTYLILQAHAPQWLALLAGALAAGLVGVIVALPAIRLRGLELALITFAAALAGTAVFARIPELGGYDGIGGLLTPRLGGLRFATPLQQMELAAMALILVYVLLKPILAGRPGRRFLLMKADEATAASLGVHLTRDKLLAFGISSTVLGFVGGIYPLNISYLGPSLFDFDLVILLFFIVFLGGVNRLEGAIIGATVVGLIPVVLSGQADLSGIFYGISMLAALVLFGGGGLLTLIEWRPRSTTSAANTQQAVAEFNQPMGDYLPETSPTRPARAGALPAEPSASLLLEAQGISKRFGGLRAVDDASFRVHRGEIVGLVGANGAGKSTLLSLLSGYIVPDSGHVVYGGRDLRGLSPTKRAVLGMVRTFQFPVFSNEMTLRENLLVASESLSEHRSPQENVDDVLGLLALRTIGNLRVNQVAFGVQKLLDLGRALCAAPELLLLDEPAAGLGPAELPLVAATIANLRSDGKAVLVVDHNMAFVMQLADRVVVLDLGRVIAVGSPEAVAQDPRVITAYLSSDDLN